MSCLVSRVSCFRFRVSGFGSTTSSRTTSQRPCAHRSAPRPSASTTPTPAPPASSARTLATCPPLLAAISAVPPWCRGSGFGFRVSGFVFRVSGFGCSVSGDGNLVVALVDERPPRTRDHGANRVRVPRLARQVQRRVPPLIRVHHARAMHLGRGLGFGVWGLGVWGVGCGVWGLGCGVWCLVFGVGCLVFGVWCLVFGVWCLGFRV